MARVLVEFIVRFEIPRQIYSNQGRNFELLVFQEMCMLLGMEKPRTVALHSQSDGRFKRFNQIVEAILSKFLAEDQRDWDEHLLLLMMAYRSAVYETTGLAMRAYARAIDQPPNRLDLWNSRTSKGLL